MRLLAPGAVITVVAGLGWFFFSADTASEAAPHASPNSVQVGPERLQGTRDVLADSEVRSGTERMEAATRADSEDNHDTSPDGEEARNHTPGTTDPQRETRLNQLGMILEDYYQVREIEKSSKLCALVSVSIAVLLEQAGRFEEISHVPTSVSVEEGVRTMSINNRLFQFTDQEFPEYVAVQDQHLSLPPEAQTSASYTVPPELETMAMGLAERAQSALQQ